MILSCRDLFDLRRAREWTEALSRWSGAQQGLKPYRGQCLVHRSEIMQLQSAWSEAMEEGERACGHLADPPGNRVMGMARYCCACGASSAGRRRRTARRASWGVRCSPAWPCCASSGAGSTTRRR